MVRTPARCSLLSAAIRCLPLAWWGSFLGLALWSVSLFQLLPEELEEAADFTSLRLCQLSIDVLEEQLLKVPYSQAWCLPSLPEAHHASDDEPADGHSGLRG